MKRRGKGTVFEEAGEVTERTKACLHVRERNQPSTDEKLA